MLILESLALPFGVDDAGVVQQSIQNDFGRDSVAENLAPVYKAVFRGQDQPGALMAKNDQTE